MAHPSLTVLSSAVLILAAWSLATALAVFLLMEYRQQRQLARESRRLMLIDLLAPAWKRESLRELWAVSRRSDREILEEVVVARRQVLEGEHGREFEQAIVFSGIYDHWLEQLRRGRVRHQVRAAMRLGLVQEERTVQALVAATRDPSPEVVLAGAISLGRLENPRALPGLMGLTEKPPKVIPDFTLAAALAACAAECPQQLTPLLRAPGIRSRVIGAWALSEVANDAVLPEMLAAAGESEPEVRAKIARALARTSKVASLEPLLRLARDPVWFVRVRALDALGRQGAVEGEAVALAALGDTVREVRYRAAFTLRRVGGMKSEVVRKALGGELRASFESLISEWERAGFLWSVADALALRDAARFRESEELVRTLAAAGVTEALVHLVSAHPDLKVRLRLLRLLAESPLPRTRRKLQTLALQPGCDPRVASAIRRRLPQTPATPISAA